MTVRSPTPCPDDPGSILDWQAPGQTRDTRGAPPVFASVFIDNEPRHAVSGEILEVIDPSTERVIAGVGRGAAEDIDAAAMSARAALQGSWGAITPQQRGDMLLTLAAALETHAEQLARLETLDVGKPLDASRDDVVGSVATLRYNAGAADKLEGSSVPLGREFLDFTELEPLGVTAHITPWNFPLGMAARSVAPALAAGCTTIVKPAEQSSFTTLALAELAAGAGFPPGVINVVTGFGEEAGTALVTHPSVDGVTFTGSVETGRKVGAAAGQSIKPVVLELGGKNPMIVFADADMERAVNAALDGAFDNSGQVCSSVSRLLLQHEIKDAFLKAFVARAERLTTTAGRDSGDLGPLVSEDQFNKVTRHIADAIERGGRLLLGGTRPNGCKTGYFMQPTVFRDVDPSSMLASEETFGPVVSAFGFDGEDEAIALANGLPYGLAAGIHTGNIDRALRLARRLEAGTVWINGWFIGGVQAPTGGVKSSGFGRERGLAGINNYLRIKNVGLHIASATDAKA